MKESSYIVRTYTGVIALIGILLSVFATFTWAIPMDAQSAWIAPVLVALIALAGRFPFKISPQADASLVTLPTFMAVLLLHPAEAALVGVVGTLVSEVLLKAPVRALVFNMSVSGVVGSIAGIVFWSLGNGLPIGTLSSSILIAAIASGLILLITEKSLLFGIVTLVKGGSFWRHWHETWTFAGILEGSLLILGMAGARLVADVWWWLPVLFVPFIVTYYGFRHSVEKAVEKARLAEELERNLKELKETQAQLVQSAKLATVGTLAAGVAHEINNPLTVITARSELLLASLEMKGREIDVEKTKSSIDDMHHMAERISKIVSGLLSYSRRSEDMSEVGLDELMDDALPLLERKFERKNVTLAREYEGTPKVKVVANQLQQVFMNLVGNALDAMPEWGTITLGCTIQDGVALAYVRDTGTGIPPAVLDRIFEPFFTTKDVGKGTGLGLYICHKIVTDHGGELSVESKEGVGTTFWVKLPMLKDEEESQTLSAVAVS